IVLPARGASGGVRKWGGIAFRSRRRRERADAEAEGRWLGTAATSGRADAALSPSSQGGVSGFSASRSPARQGRAARHPGGGLARPGEKPGSVRTHLRRRSPGLSEAGWRRSRGARDQERRGGGLVRLAQAGFLALPTFPCARPPDAKARTRPPAPLAFRGARRAIPRAA